MTLRKEKLWNLKAEAVDYTLEERDMEEAMDLSQDRLRYE
jgi:hypothetical protein